MAGRINCPCAAICHGFGNFVTTAAATPSVGEIHYYVSANREYFCAR